MKTLRTWLKSLLLTELLQGMALTLGFFFKPKFTIRYPEERTPKSPRYRGLHAQRRCADGTRRTTRYDIDLFKCIYCGFCEEACPVDAIVETSITDFHFEKAGEQIMTKEKLLAVGDRFEPQIAADRAADARYR